MRQFIKSDIIFYILLMTLGLGGFFCAILWPQTEGFYGAIMAASLAGIGVTLYIFYAKRFKQHLACPTGDDCNAVVTSKYSKFLGIPLEYLGTLYYGTILVAYTGLIAQPALRESILMPTVLVLTAASFLFSVYLLFIQGFILKKWCIWCLLSATLSTFIFIISLISIEGASAFLIDIEPALSAIKQLGFVLGMGGATTAVLLFVRFLEDLDISQQESAALKDITELIWIGLAMILLSEYARYVAFSEQLVDSSIFIAEIITLSVAFISGAVLKILFAPFLDVLPFEEESEEDNKKQSPLVPLRKATLITGGITMTSWYFAFTVNYFPPLSLDTLLGLYILFVLIVLGINLIWQTTFDTQTKQSEDEHHTPQ